MDKTCKICNKLFTRPFSYRRHMLNIHGVESAWRKGVSYIEESDSPPRKRFLIGTDKGFGWKNLLSFAYEEYD